MFTTKRTFRNDISIAIAAGLILSMLGWAVGLRVILQTANAASLTSISDTLSDSRPGIAANHTIQYTTNATTTANQTILVTFDPNTSLFGGVGSVVTGDISNEAGINVVSTCSAGSDNVTLSTSTNALTFTVCTGNTGISPGTIRFTVGNTKITNPTSTGSYVIRIGGTQANSGDTRVAIVNAVQVTAAIDTTFTFTVTGVATGTTLLNGATTTGASASTSLPFGTISPNTHAELAQQLAVSTNASNGFAVTVHEDQDLTSDKGNTIHVFDDGNATSVPSTWVAPSSQINQPQTYGHFGITSDDASGTLQFGTSTPLYAGSFNPTSTLTVFAWTGPADGTTQNVGKATVGFRIEIGPLQPAANDYTNNLIYVATPTF